MLHRYRIRRIIILLLIYLSTAYLVMPFVWRQPHPVCHLPTTTCTKTGIPGDPVNLVLIGYKSDLLDAMRATNWHPADSLTFYSCVRIAVDTVLNRPYKTAPVSHLYLWGRKEDVAFQQAVGDSPRQRHHVRFWLLDQLSSDGLPVWVGSATYDTDVGFSSNTGQVTHHISSNVDEERDYLLQDFAQSGELLQVCTVDDFHKILQGRNGGGDPWKTDGKLLVGTIK